MLVSFQQKQTQKTTTTDCFAKHKICFAMFCYILCGGRKKHAHRARACAPRLASARPTLTVARPRPTLLPVRLDAFAACGLVLRRAEPAAAAAHVANDPTKPSPTLPSQKHKPKQSNIIGIRIITKAGWKTN